VQMLTATVVMTGVVFVVEPNPSIVYTPESVGALLYLATFGSVGAFFLGFYVIRRYEVSVVSSFVFLQPIFAVVLGALLFGEAVTWALVVSLFLISVGLVFVNRRSQPVEPVTPPSGLPSPVVPKKD
jgi:drug/metabolite transporter (DMT)-like permease